MSSTLWRLRSIWQEMRKVAAGPKGARASTQIPVPTRHTFIFREEGRVHFGFSCSVCDETVAGHDVKAQHTAKRAGADSGCRHICAAAPLTDTLETKTMRAASEETESAAGSVSADDRLKANAAFNVDG